MLGAEIMVALDRVIVKIVEAGLRRKESVVEHAFRIRRRKQSQDLSCGRADAVRGDQVAGKRRTTLLAVNRRRRKRVEDLAGDDAPAGAGIHCSGYGCA